MATHRALAYRTLSIQRTLVMTSKTIPRITGNVMKSVGRTQSRFCGCGGSCIVAPARVFAGCLSAAVVSSRYSIILFLSMQWLWSEE
jgi:hypothetical protein